jgi:hypothetical protein
MYRASLESREAPAAIMARDVEDPGPGKDFSILLKDRVVPEIEPSRRWSGRGSFVEDRILIEEVRYQPPVTGSTTQLCSM